MTWWEFHGAIQTHINERETQLLCYKFQNFNVADYEWVMEKKLGPYKNKDKT